MRFQARPANLSQAEQMPRVLEIAIQTALAKRGVAVVVLPGDVALRDALTGDPGNFFVGRSNRRANLRV